MRKVIRPTYPVEFSVGLLLLIFVLSLFLSGQIFEVPKSASADENYNIYVGMVLVSSAVIIVLLVLWEEFLFPVRVRHITGGLEFRNHRNKLKTQLLIYCIIPVIFVFIYFNYEVNHVRFFIWAAICVVAPVAGKLVSGLNNYNDFLKLTNDFIEYKNNQEVGNFAVGDIQKITLVKDERKVLHKVQLSLRDNTLITIDLDEMELEAFYIAIDEFIATHYERLVG